ncbi:hypothetical protein CY34DRAFT_813061 [Suillus luteus UH-Slu-Lm8-n1]|uniref:Uncharacterized protein n=1 Tax=Suillus luteus UH-Slu-Lm8-n1 TaxID=930992 RepID=A0A0C9ZXN2_9AGAM|nr:hypothetical protein CY34DRAFT_813061 [Suillus luteus UH-Slu-Lm8-n1]
MRQPCNLLIESKSHLALLFGNFQLTLLILSNILHADLGAKKRVSSVELELELLFDTVIPGFTGAQIVSYNSYSTL